MTEYEYSGERETEVEYLQRQRAYDLEQAYEEIAALRSRAEMAEAEVQRYSDLTAKQEQFAQSSAREIVSLRERVKELEEGLRPLADAYDKWLEEDEEYTDGVFAIEAGKYVKAVRAANLLKGG